MFKNFKKWWLFHLANPVVRSGESGGFKWVFRRFTLDISTLSGNFSARFTANEHPYAYLLAGKNDENIIGFVQTLYYLSMTLTTDQGLVDDISRAIRKFEKRVEMIEPAEEPEEAAIAEVKAIQEYVEAPKKEKRKIERDVNGRFKKAVKAVEESK